MLVSVVPTFVSGAGAPVIPSSRTTMWMPGVTYNTVPGQSSKGIPNYANIYTTLSPLGGTNDDKAQIQSALDGAGAVATQNNPQVVKLNTGVFRLSGALFMKKNYVVLRGSGPGTGAANFGHGNAGFVADVAATQLLMTGSDGIIAIGAGGDYPFQLWAHDVDKSGSFNLSADAHKDDASVTLTVSSHGISVGDIVIIDHLAGIIATTSPGNTYVGNDPDCIYGYSHVVSAGVHGRISGGGTVLNVDSVEWGVVGVSGLPVNADTPLISTSAMGGTSGFYTDGNGPWVSGFTSGTRGGIGQYTIGNSGTPAIDNASSVPLLIGGGNRREHVRQDRPIVQMLKVSSITNSGFTLNFETPLRHNHPVNYNAQIAKFNPFNPNLSGVALVTGCGIEELMVFGGTSGNIAIGPAQYCWVKHVDSAWSTNWSVAFGYCYRCELRDSFCHETPNPNPGGAGYLILMNNMSSDCLVENSISWYGNKVVVSQGGGSGNVFGYNYMDDAFGGTYPDSPEAGMNFGHHTCPHMNLMEGNYTHAYTADGYWGNSIDITALRNQFSGIRAAHAPLPTLFPGYGDVQFRGATNIQAESLRHNFVGNILGKSGQTLGTHDGFVFEGLTSSTGNAPPDSPFSNPVWMWYIGGDQNTQSIGISGFTWQNNAYQTHLRDGNWDFVTSSQTWLGIGGTQSLPLGTAKPIMNSLYTPSIPPFFTTNSYSANTWPWVNPSNGITATLPAKARFDAGTPNVL